MNKEALEKSIDALIEEVFSEETPSEEQVVKAKPVMDELIGSPKQSSEMKNGSSAGPSQTEADQVKVDKAKKEKEGENGRPKDVQDVPSDDEDGSRAKGYEHIQEKNEKTPDISAKGTMVKSEKFEITKEEYELLQKAKKAQEEEVLKKAEERQSTLIKSAVIEATKAFRDENTQLKKSLEETQTLVKAMAKKPQPRKSISDIQSLEKSFDGGQPGTQKTSYSKEEMMDVAEELVKSKKLTLEQAIELEDTGYLYDATARATLERELRKRG